MENIVVLVIVGATLAWAGRRLFRKRGSPGCGGCGGCGGGDTGPKLVPLSRRRP